MQQSLAKSEYLGYFACLVFCASKYVIIIVRLPE